MKFLYIFLVLIFILLIMPIRIRIVRNDKHNDIDIYFVKIFNIRFDLDAAIKKFFSDKNSNDAITLDKILYNIGLIIKSSNIIKDTISLMTVSKLTWIMKTKSKNKETEVFAIVASWNGILYLRKLIYKNFKEVKNEYYSVQNQGAKIDALFDAVLDFRIIYFLFAVFKNYKDIKKIRIFVKKGSEKDV